MNVSLSDLLKSAITIQAILGITPIRNLAYVYLYENMVKWVPSIQKWVGSLKRPELPRECRSEIECERGTNAAQNTKGGAPPFLTRMDAVIHYVTCTPAIRKLLAVANHDYLPYEFDPVCIDTDVYFQLKSVEVDDGAIKNIKFRIFSNEHDIQHLQKFVETCNQDYERRMVNKLGTHLYFFDQVVQKNTKRSSQNPLPTQFLVYSKHKFSTTRTFDNVYFDQQAKVRKHTDFFLTNRRWYEKKGIPYTLGFLFHGDPGCGKTSETKAIANVARRHIINVQLSEIKTKSQLRHLFFSEEINVYNGNTLERFIIPIHERLYVIEDIDAMGDTVLRREWKKPEVEKKAEDPFAVDDNEVLKDPIDLSFLLNILDGTLESAGRMLVITSNFPERIDRALIRPGRIDMIVNFMRCSTAVLRQMVEGFYDKEAPDHPVWTDEAMNQKWTPAEVNQILFRNFDTPDTALDELLALNPRDLYGFQLDSHE
uniref:ATPase AAA-type core domain-containing protein n=1 Tax=viral metagenome TaxID=1070528 RepID=A0A6C0I5Q9_9ZZZZ